jgi:hypothetical protein
LLQLWKIPAKRMVRGQRLNAGDGIGYRLLGRRYGVLARIRSRCRTIVVEIGGNSEGHNQQPDEGDYQTGASPSFARIIVDPVGPEI